MKRDAERIDPWERFLSGREVRETRLVPGPRSEVSSMAGEVVTGYHSRHAPVGIFRWLTTTNHHEIGILYLANSFVFFLIGGGLPPPLPDGIPYPRRTRLHPPAFLG